MRLFFNISKTAIGCLLAVCMDGLAQSPPRQFNIPAGDMKLAIDTYATQSGVQLIYKVAEVKGLAGPAVKGTMAPEAALSLLLKGSPLQIVRDGANAVMVFRPVPAAPPAPTPRASAEPEEAPARVLVSGLRASLESARNQKRDNDVIGDAIVAADIGKLPDQNIAEAAQRIPGVQMQRYMEEGGAIAIRGLKQSKILLNGLEVFGASAHAGEYNGRNFDLEDLPAEVLAGVDVSKSSAARDIEGGLGGHVDIRTRQPFDFKGPIATVSVKATDYRMAPGLGSHTRAQSSALMSGRWTTDAGEMGLLLNLAHTDSMFGQAENEVQRTHVQDNYAGSGKAVTLPIGMFTGNGHHGERERDTYIAAFQWRVGAHTQLFANYTGIHYLMRNAFQTARLYAGSPSPDFTLWGERNGDGSDNLRSGTFSDNALNVTSAVAEEGRKTTLYDIGGTWHDGAALTIKARLSHNDTAVLNTLFEWGLSASVPSMRLTLNDGAPSRVAVSGIDLTKPANYRPAYLLAIDVDGTQKNTALVLDAHHRIDRAALRSVDVGVRLNDYTRRSFGYVHFYCIDTCNGGRTLATVDPPLLYQVPAAESPDIGAYPTFSSAAVRQQAALRALYGLPATDANTRDQDRLNREKTAAAYLMFNFDLALASLPVRGNLGVRYIATSLHGEAFGANAAGLQERQAVDTTRRDVLPSFNANLGVRDDLSLRLAASKTLGQLDFAYMNPALNIGNQVQRDAQIGNPNLKPYTSKNLDLSLERYVGARGMAYLGMFYKLADGFIQTVAEQRVINGEQYNVSTYRSAGTARIKGAEIGYQQFFDQLPAPWRGLGLQANYTYVDARAPSSVAGQTVPLEALSKNSYNLIGIYERGKVTARLAYNYRSGFVATTSSSGAQGVPILAKALGTLDFSIAFALTRQLSLLLDGVNIAGARNEQYYGNTHNQMNYQALNQRFGVQARYVF
ncbi:MAG: TonB-dependent receptor [Massilia sp.]